MQAVVGSALVTDERSLGDLEDEMLGREVVPAKKIVELIGEPGVEQVDGREIDGQVDDHALRAEGDPVRDRLAQHVAVDLGDEPCALGLRDERVGEQRAARRMLPAHECLDAANRARGEVCLRLVVDDQLAACGAPRGAPP